MSRDELLALLRELENGDPEGSHLAADRALLKYIDDEEIAEAFEAIEKWYS